MKKDQAIILSWGVTVFAAICGVTAFFVIFADAVRFSGVALVDTLTGIQAALGFSINKTYQLFGASAGIIIAYLFSLLGASGAIIGKGIKVVTALSAAMMLTGGVLLLCLPNLLNNVNLTATALATAHLAPGGIASGVLAIVGGVTAGASLLLKA